MAETIYRGFSTKVRFGTNTSVADVELVIADLLNHFHTRVRERVGRGYFGSIIEYELFEHFDDVTQRRVASDAQRIIASDPRVRLDDLQVALDDSESADSERSIRVDITATMVETDMQFQFSVEFRGNR